MVVGNKKEYIYIYIYIYNIMLRKYKIKRETGHIKKDKRAEKINYISHVTEYNIQK